MSTAVNNARSGTSIPPGRPPIPPLTCQVPDGLFDIPFKQDRPKIWRFESGLVLDPQLRKMTRLSGAVDRSLALRLARLRTSNGFFQLSYANFTDYVQERLNLNPRTAREFVRLGKALDRLPILDEALRHGKVNWSAALQVARLVREIGSEDDQRKWVAIAQRCNVRELTKQVTAELNRDADGASKSNSDQAKGSGPADGSKDDGSNDDGSKDDGSADTETSQPEDPEDDPIAKLRATTRADTARYWAASLELCEIVVGRRLAAGEGEEYILADFLSGTVPTPPDHIPCDPFRPPLAHPRSPRRKPLPNRATPTSELGGRRLSIELSQEIARALMIVDSEVPHDPFELDASMRQLLKSRAGIDLDLARLLRNFQSLNLAKHLGFDNFGHYVAERLGISADRARFLVTVDRQVSGFSAIDAAVRRGQIGTSAALLVARVAREGSSESAWVQRARTRTLLRLREEVAWAQRQRERLNWRWDGMPPPPGPLPSDLAEITASISPTDGDAPFQHRSHEPWFPISGDPDIDKFLHHESTKNDLPESRWRGAPADGIDCEMSAGDPNAGPPVRVEFWLPESVVPSWDEARQRIGAAAGLNVVSDSRVLFEISVAFLRTYLPLWIEAVETMDPIAIRDGIRCQIPGCTNRRGAGHHIHYRSRGGSDDPANLLFVCEKHHLDGIHGPGHIRLSGLAPNLLVVEMGIRPDGTPLQTFIRRPARSTAARG